MEEKVLGVIQPFRKLLLLLTVMMVGLTTAWSFEFATVALSAPTEHYLQVVGIIVAVQGLITYLMKMSFDLYWKGRS